MKHFYLSAALLAASMLAQPAFAADGDVPTEPITETPDGVTEFYNESYGGWVYYGSWSGLQYMGGTKTNKMVWCDNNEVYIAAPVASYSSANGYAKGVYSDGKITLQLPQCVGKYYDQTDQIYKPLYLNKMEEVEVTGDPDNEDGKYYMICYEEDNTVEYTVDADGNVTLDLGNGEFDVDAGNNPKYVLGVTYTNEPHAFQVWTGYGDAVEQWNIIRNPDPVCPPESAVRQDWGFNTRGKLSIIDVAIDGDDIYLSGISQYSFGYWFKGKIDGDKITFPDKQYMGMNQHGQFYYFRAARIYVEGGWNKYEAIDEVTLTLNPETNMYEAVDQAFLICGSTEALSASSIAENPKIWQQSPEMLKAAPNNPSVKSFTDFIPLTKQGSIVWTIPNTNANGAILNGDNMYYNLYVDGEIYEFTPDLYPLFEEATINVPYKASNYNNIYVYNTDHTIYYYFSDAESFSLQSFYVDADGETHKSQKVTYNVATGEQTIEEEEEEIPTEPIIEAPDGTLEYYNETYGGWVYWGEWAGLQYMGGSGINKMVWCDNNEVYISSPVASYSTNGLAKGTYADGKITVKLPQCIGQYYDQTEGAYLPLYLNKLEEVEVTGDPDHEDGKYYMICQKADNTVVYNVDADGNITLDLGNGEFDVESGNNPKYLLGVTYTNEPHAFQVWTGYGNAVDQWNIIRNPEPVCPPETAEHQEWVFETHGNCSVVDVAVDGNDFYFTGISSYSVGYWIKGIKDDDKITFADGQFMGMNQYEQFYYFRAAKIVYNEETGWNEYEPIDKVTLTFNPDNKHYVAKDEVLLICGSPTEMSYSSIAENPSLWQQTPEMLKAAPKNPSVTRFTEYNAQTGQGTIVWDIPNSNVNDAVLNTDQMYYNLYVDDELYEFEPDLYPLFEETTVDVPYTASNFYDIYVYKTSHTIYFYFSDPESFSLQSFYVDADGETYASEKVTYQIQSGINSASVAKEAVDVTYTSLSGVVTKNPANGMYIRTTTYSDGSRKVEKVAIRK